MRIAISVYDAIGTKRAEAAKQHTTVAVSDPNALAQQTGAWLHSKTTVQAVISQASAMLLINIGITNAGIQEVSPIWRSIVV